MSDRHTRPRASTDPSADDERARKRPNTAVSNIPSFPSYLDEPDLPPKIKLLCEIVATTPSHSVESSLDSSGVRVSHEDVEHVLKLSYSHPGQALKFFRWSGAHLSHQHSPYAWNLVVDLLGKNQLFEAMWDAAKSMLPDSLLSLATFASIFSSYAAAHRLDDAITAFLVMDRYSVPRDTPALNSLLSAACRHSQTQKALEFLARSRREFSIRPDPDSYAIVLEGCEDEADHRAALQVFSEMVDIFGWDPANGPAYDSFLCAITRGPGGVREALRHLEILRGRGCPPGIKFFRFALEEAVKAKDPEVGTAVWQVMHLTLTRPDSGMYNSMIALLCYSSRIDTAFEMLDRMVEHAVFPDGETYNLMLQFTIKAKKLRDAGVLFREMIKNEFLPTEDNCMLAFKTFMDAGEGEMMMRVWRCMVENNLGSLEACGNNLVLRLRDLDLLPEACKYAEAMADKGIKLNSSTLSKLRANLVKIGKGNIYDQILKKWKSY